MTKPRFNPRFTLKAADLFCGAGGTSQGLVEACEELDYKVELTAINHWQVAVATHHANHPKARHLCTGLDSVNPRDLYRPGTLDVLWASPECTHHSNARGGKTINEQSRATAWCVCRWAEALRPNIILVENVPEFETWGPVNRLGKPIKSRKGEIFQSWVANLRAIGYTVEWRVLCAADYGDPTTRRRLFVQCVRGRRKIVWPDPTHYDPDSKSLRVPHLKPWATARNSVIDWSLQGESIFHSEKYKKKPLKPKTMRRIFIGLEKFGLQPFFIPREGLHGGNAPRSVNRPLHTVIASHNSGAIAQPYLIKLRGTNDASDIDKPAPTVTGGGQHLGVAETFLVNTAHASKGKESSRTRSTKKPLPTVAGNRGEWAVIEPFLIGQQSGSAPRPVSKPAPTVAGAGAIALCESYLVTPSHGNGDNPNADNHRTRSVDRPLPTVLAGDGSVGDWGICDPCIIAIDHKGGNGNQVRSVDKPISAVTSKQRHAVVQPFMVQMKGKSTAQSIDKPLTSQAGNQPSHGVVKPYITQYYGSSAASSIETPLDTVTSKDRFALCQPVVEIQGERYLIDIRFRMLTWPELAAAQGFLKSYKFTGNITQTVKQIGNAVPRNLARALVKAVVSQKSKVN